MKLWYDIILSCKGIRYGMVILSYWVSKVSKRIYSMVVLGRRHKKKLNYGYPLLLGKGKHEKRYSMVVLFCWVREDKTKL